MDDATIKKLVSDYLSQTLTESLDARIAAPPLSREEREQALYTHETALDEAAQDLSEGRHRKLENVAELILDAAGISLPKESPERLRLCHELLRGIVEVVLPTGIERLKGNYRSEYEARLQGSSGPGPVTTQDGKRTDPKDGSDAGEPLSKLVQEFIRESADANKWRDRSKREAEGCLALFLRIVGGERRIGTISKKDLAGFRDTLTRWPSNASKRYPGRSVQEVLAMAEAPFLSVTTINNHLGYVSQLYSWCVSNDRTASRPIGIG